MHRVNRHILAVLLALLWLGGSSAWAEEKTAVDEGMRRELRGVALPTKGDVVRHRVQEGDTLWAIASTYLEDPFYWPKVWGTNRFIQNPDLIYPGALIMLPIPEPIQPLVLPPMKAPAKVVVAKKMPEVVAPMPEPAAEPAAPMMFIPKRREADPDLLLLASSGYILAGKFEEPGVLIGAKDHRTLLGERDLVYLNPKRIETLEIGDQLLIYRNVRKIYHPMDKTYLGDLLVALGILEVREVGRKIVTAQITKAYHHIFVGDPVAPYEMVPLPGLDKNPAAEAEELEGYIVDVREGKVIAGQFDVVYIDRGLLDGVGRGSSFRVVREGDWISMPTGDKTQLPSRIIAQAEVITVNDQHATARVQKSTEAVHRGDRIEFLPIE